MCNPACIDFVKMNIRSREAKNKLVLEVGARNFNGSVRDAVTALKPYAYIGTDIVAGPGVDEICDAVELVETYGADNFDLLLTTEALEHIQDWRAAISNFKRVLKPGGVLYLTTRSKGCPFHEYPGDYWRFEIADMEAIFADFDILVLERDQTDPGVFLKARKPEEFVEVDLSGYAVWSMQPGIVDPSRAPEPPAEQPDPDKPPHVWGIA